MVRVTLELASPVVVPQERMLFGDALLLAAYIKNEHPDDWASRRPSTWTQPDLPVVWDKRGFWHVSCIAFEDVAENRDHSRYRVERRPKHIDDQVTFPTVGKSGKLICAPANLEWAYRGNITNLTLLTARQACFLAEVPEEKMEQFAALLGTLSRVSVGSGRHQGYGVISGISAEPASEESAIWDQGGAPRRPIPVNAEDAKPPNSVLRMVRISPPYWHGPLVLAACPLPDALEHRLEPLTVDETDKTEPAESDDQAGSEEPEEEEAVLE